MDYGHNDTFEDIFSDLNYNNETDTLNEPTYSHVHFILEIAVSLLDFLIGASSVLANILVIYVISKFPKLKTQINFIILNFSLCHLLYMLLDPLFSLFHALLLDARITVKWYCIVFRFEDILLILHFLFIGFLAVDLYIKSYQVWLTVKYQIYFKLIVASIYVIGFVIAIGETISCFLSEYKFNNVTMLVNFFLVTIIILALRVMVYVKAKKGNPPSPAAKFSLSVCTWFLVFWIPIWIAHVVGNVVAFYFARMFAYCNPIFNVFLYARLNKNYRVAYHKVYRCQLQNYENDFEDEVGPDVDENVSTVQIVIASSENEASTNGVGQNHQQPI